MKWNGSMQEIHHSPLLNETENSPDFWNSYAFSTNPNPLPNMNGRTIALDAFHSFDKSTGSFSMKCVCGATNTLMPEDINQPLLTLKCCGCYMQYEVRVTGT